jgi:hypothetical protein
VRELGTLRRIDARSVWFNEARDFTPWLRDHISLLGAALGMDLDLVESEVRVGPFAADLVAKDVSSDRIVVIENQLEPTDHGHLGQILTYGAGTGASVFVWISPEFREEHRAALDWLMNIQIPRPFSLESRSNYCRLIVRTRHQTSESCRRPM